MDPRDLGPGEDGESPHAQASRTARERLQREHDDLRRVVTTPEGQRMVARLLLRSGVFDAVRTSTQAEASFLEGRRHTGLVLSRLLQDVDPKTFGHIVSLMSQDL